MNDKGRYPQQSGAAASGSLRSGPLRPKCRVGHSPNLGAFVCFHVPLRYLHRSVAKEKLYLCICSIFKESLAATLAMPAAVKIGLFEWDCNFAVTAGCGRVHHGGDPFEMQSHV